MPRALLIHWKPAEAEARVERLRAAGFEVELYSEDGGAGLRALGADPPDVVVVDQDRLPSHGRAVGVFLRQQKRTRSVPLVFAGGAAEKVAIARELLPDAVFASWRGIRGALRRVLARPPVDPVVPDTMQGYAGTPLPKKLGLKAGITLALLGAPEGFDATLGALPSGVTLRRRAQGPADLIVLFAGRQSALERRFAAAARALAERGRLWIAWPKKTSPLAADLSQQGVREYGLARGLVDFKICAIDATWSGLCFVRRRA